MTAEQLKELEDRLWEAADKLRVDSGLKASEYYAYFRFDFLTICIYKI